MTPAAQGRHCAACSKVVVDFTQKTDAEILALLRHTAAPCGRFRADQIERVLQLPSTPAPRWRTWLAAAATVLGLREIPAETSQGQQPHTKQLASAKAATTMHQTALLSVEQTPVVVRGTILNSQTYRPLVQADIYLAGAGNPAVATQTDEQGRFELSIPKAQWVASAKLLQVSAPGCKVMNLRLATDAAEKSPDLEILLIPGTSGIVLGELSVVPDSPAAPDRKPGLWERLRNAFHR